MIKFFDVKYIQIQCLMINEIEKIRISAIYNNKNEIWKNKRFNN